MHTPRYIHKTVVESLVDSIKTQQRVHTRYDQHKSPVPASAVEIKRRRIKKVDKHSIILTLSMENGETVSITVERA